MVRTWPIVPPVGPLLATSCPCVVRSSYIRESLCSQYASERIPISTLNWLQRCSMDLSVLSGKATCSGARPSQKWNAPGRTNFFLFQHERSYNAENTNLSTYLNSVFNLNVISRTLSGPLAKCCSLPHHGQIDRLRLSFELLSVSVSL